EASRCSLEGGGDEAFISPLGLVGNGCMRQLPRPPPTPCGTSHGRGGTGDPVFAAAAHSERRGVDLTLCQCFGARAREAISERCAAWSAPSASTRRQSCSTASNGW